MRQKERRETGGKKREDEPIRGDGRPMSFAKGSHIAVRLRRNDVGESLLEPLDKVAIGLLGVFSAVEEISRDDRTNAAGTGITGATADLPIVEHYDRTDWELF